MTYYEHQKIEKKWQKYWRDNKTFEIDNKTEKENFYLLTEFPYPSGNLHVGHWYAFCVPDIFARYQRMLGKNILFPFGFDAFGLPAENAAIKNNLNPNDWTEKNMEYMRGQIDSMGASFDRSREFATCDPEYYKWTQWLFLQFFKHGLAEQRKTNVNWCPSCKTVLANEQVKEGTCERCDTTVSKKNMKQWNLKITDFADALIDDLKELDWPEEIKSSQTNWIGRSYGAEVDFEVEGHDEKLTVFTTRPDTLFGATFFVVSPEHPIVEKITTDENKAIVKTYQASCAAKSEMERTELNKNKSGVFTGGFVKNPVTGEQMPIWIADYVLMSYGTGAIMAVPAHDERDYEFAQKYDLEIKEVVEGIENPFEKTGGKLKNSEFLDGLPITEAIEKMTQFLEEKEIGKQSKNYKLRDWTVSRQRYWGCPIPIVHCADCGPVAVLDADLPVKLPELDNYLPREDGASPLAKSETFLKTSCPTCGKEAERETDTFDTFMCSSWYFLRYLDPKNKETFANPEAMNDWLPVDLYSGGAEHTTMHLLYSRFFYKAMHQIGLAPTSEPYKFRMNRGLILGPDQKKMSKSKGNVIDPDAVVADMGADTVRMYLAFIGPFNEVGQYPWSPEGIKGIRRFLDKVWNFFETNSVASETDKSLLPIIHKTIKIVSDNTGKMKFNKAISQFMICFNELGKTAQISKADSQKIITLLLPFAPHLSEELWEHLGNKTPLSLEDWPQHDAKYLVEDEVTYAIQVNGKLRADLVVSKDATKENILATAKTMDKVAKYLAEGNIVKEIFVPGKIVGFVVK